MAPGLGQLLPKAPTGQAADLGHPPHGQVPRANLGPARTHSQGVTNMGRAAAPVPWDWEGGGTRTPRQLGQEKPHVQRDNVGVGGWTECPLASSAQYPTDQGGGGVSPVPG